MVLVVLVQLEVVRVGNGFLICVGQTVVWLVQDAIAYRGKLESELGWWLDVGLVRVVLVCNACEDGSCKCVRVAIVVALAEIKFSNCPIQRLLKGDD